MHHHKIHSRSNRTLFLYQNYLNRKKRKQNVQRWKIIVISILRSERNSFFNSCLFFLTIFLSCLRIRIWNCVDLSVASSHHLSLFITGVPFVIIIIKNKLRSCFAYHSHLFCCQPARIVSYGTMKVRWTQFSNGISIMNLLFRIVFWMNSQNNWPMRWHSHEPRTKMSEKCYYFKECQRIHMKTEIRIWMKLDRYIRSDLRDVKRIRQFELIACKPQAFYSSAIVICVWILLQ